MIKIAHAIWTGSLSCGMINIPVKLNSAVKEKKIQFHQINKKTGNRISMKRVDAANGQEVPYEDVVKGYEISPDQHILVEPSEIDALDPDKTSTINIDTFVDPGELDPVMFNHPYYLVPDKSEESYALMLEALKKSGKAGIGKFVMRGSEYVTCVWAHGDALALSTMHYADEVVKPEVDISKVQTQDAHLNMAVSIIEALTDEHFDMSTYKDEHREKVVKLVQDKADGVVTATPAPAPATPQMSSLLASLEATMKAAKSIKDSKTPIQKVAL